MNQNFFKQYVSTLGTADEVDFETAIKLEQKRLLDPMLINNFVSELRFSYISHVDIRPQGSAELIFGLKINRLDNPSLAVSMINTFFINLQISNNSHKAFLS